MDKRLSSTCVTHSCSPRWVSSHLEYFLFKWIVLHPNRRARYGESTWAQLYLPVYRSHRGANLWSVYKTNIRWVKAVYRWHRRSFLWQYRRDREIFYMYLCEWISSQSKVYLVHLWWAATLSRPRFQTNNSWSFPLYKPNWHPYLNHALLHHELQLVFFYVSQKDANFCRTKI